MPNTRIIEKNESFKHSDGDLYIRAWAGDAHSADIFIQKNGTTVRSGTNDIDVTVSANAGDVIYVEGTIYKPEGSSSHVSFNVQMKNASNDETFQYSTTDTEHDVIIYQVTITLTP